MKKNLFKIIALFILSPFLAKAALIYTSIGGNIYFEIEPKNPGSFTDTKITVTSNQINTDRTYFVWYLEGKKEKEGLGAKTLTFQTKQKGRNIEIQVFASTESGEEIQKTMFLNPADVDIVWEADTYTPPLYKGKALASPGSNIKLMAIPHLITENGTRLPANDLNYEWRVNNNIISSGFGKVSAMTKIETPYSQNLVSVKVSNSKGDITAENIITIRPETVTTIFYKENPVEGTMYNGALSFSEKFYEQEFSIRAEPYFFSYPDSPSDRNLEFRWSLNGGGITPNEGTPKIITLRNETGKETNSSLQLSIRNLQKVFQNSMSSLMINSIPDAFKF